MVLYLSVKVLRMCRGYSSQLAGCTVALVSWLMTGTPQYLLSQGLLSVGLGAR
jgi:hypothetical protein